jgi:AcrR family transcriptional regulator
MPQLWAETVRAHQEEVRDAILEAVDELVRTRGLLALNMSHIAAAAGIGRATLYKYFSDIEQVVVAWHERQVTAHLAQLDTIREQPGESAERLRSVLAAYGRICQQRQNHADELTAALHRSQPANEGQARLITIVTDLIAGASAAKAVRRDVPPQELAAYCVCALEAASSTSTPAELARLLQLIWVGLAPPEAE